MKTKNLIFQLIFDTPLHFGDTSEQNAIRKNIRDQENDIPFIPPASLKGSIRKMLEVELRKQAESLPEDENEIYQLLQCFDNRRGPLAVGKIYIHFWGVHLLTLPIRGEQGFFYNAISPKIINTFNEYYKFCKSEDFIKIPPSSEQVKTEVGLAAYCPHIPLLGDNIVILSDSQMENALSQLPLIERSNLETGFSHQLYYEEMIPTNSKFFVFISFFKHETLELDKIFVSNTNNKYIQIGISENLGCGHCKMSQIG